MIQQKSVNPKLWGPNGWEFMHYVALAYPDNPTEKDKKDYFIFYTNLQNILPCPRCRNNYKENLKQFPLEQALMNSESLFKWTVDIHNEVNKETNKELFSYEKAIQKYTQNKTEINQSFTIICSIAIFLLIVFLVLLFQNKKK